MSVPVYIKNLREIQNIHSALKGLRGLLLRGDEADSGIASIMRANVERLGEITSQFPDLDKAFEKYLDFHDRAVKWYADRKKGGKQ